MLCAFAIIIIIIIFCVVVVISSANGGLINILMWGFQVVVLELIGTYPNCTGPTADWRAILSSLINARVMDSVEFKPACSC